jgi:putative sugar O-methyltransferase
MNPNSPIKQNDPQADADAIRRTLHDMITELQKGRAEVQPSRYWMELNKSDQGMLYAAGYENFKQTVARHYFTWTRVWPWDPQIRFLMSQLPVTTTITNMLRTFSPLKHPHMSLAESLACNFLSNMVWDYAVKTCPRIDQLSEPAAGNPPRLLRNGRLISQDLANSALEADFVLANLPQSCKVARACELGAGYGRTAHALISLMPGVKYVVVDIPPALYVSQKYLASIYPDRKVFAWRPFGSYLEIKEEFEAADLAFLLPSQIEMLPDGLFDLFVNVSSLHEMRIDQIRYYFAQVRRLVRQAGCFYLKEWKVSRIPYENVIIRREDYPFEGWKILSEREVRIQTQFFEALLEKQ